MLKSRYPSPSTMIPRLLYNLAHLVRPQSRTEARAAQGKEEREAEREGAIDATMTVAVGAPLIVVMADMAAEARTELITDNIEIEMLHPLHRVAIESRVLLLAATTMIRAAITPLVVDLLRVSIILVILVTAAVITDRARHKEHILRPTALVRLLVDALPLVDARLLVVALPLVMTVLTTGTAPHRAVSTRPHPAMIVTSVLLPVAMVAMDRLKPRDTRNTVLIDLPNEDSLETPF